MIGWLIVSWRPIRHPSGPLPAHRRPVLPRTDGRPQARRRGFMRPVCCPGSLSYLPPYIPPNTALCTENHPGNLCKKTSPIPP